MVIGSLPLEIFRSIVKVLTMNRCSEVMMKRDYDVITLAQWQRMVALEPPVQMPRVSRGDYVPDDELPAVRFVWDVAVGGLIVYGVENVTLH
jgi:hypothetical protein